MSQMQSRLSLPPLPNYWPSGLHLSPQTSYLCPLKLHSRLELGFILMSLLWIIESKDPLERREEWSGFQERDPILPSCWPSNVLIFSNLTVSKRCIYLVEVPTARMELLPFIQATEVTISLSFSVSNNYLMSPDSEFQRYTVWAKQTDKILSLLQSRRFK